MARYFFRDWLPDEPAYESEGLVVCLNAVPTARRGFSPLGSFEPAEEAVPQKPQAAVAVRELASRTAVNYAGGATKLYQNTGTAWTDVTRASGDYTPGTYWEFDEWDQYIFATNYADKPQFATKQSGGKFDNVFGADNFRARHIGVVGNFVVYGDTYDDTDGVRPNRIRWSGLADPFTITIDPVTQSDFRNLPGDGGAVQRVIGGDIGAIFQEKSIQRMDYIGGTSVFNIDEVEKERGTNAPRSVVKIGNRCYYLATDGFRRFDYNTESVSIGETSVDYTFLQRLDPARAVEVIGVPVPGLNSVLWYYPGPDQLQDRLDSGIVYNYITQRWSELSEDDLIYAYGALSNGVSPDDPSLASVNVDLQPGSADDPIWAGGAEQLASFDTQYRLNVAGAYNRIATFETPEFQPNEGRRTWSDGVTPIIDGGTITQVEVGVRNSQADPVVWKLAQQPRASGKFPLRINARYIRFRIKVAGEFRNITGVEYETALSDAR